MHSVKVSSERMRFSAAHFVVDAGACEHLHGHNYEVELDISGSVDEHGMVIDFRELKKRAAQVCEKLDHRVLLPGQSGVIRIREIAGSVEVQVAGKRYVFPREDCLILPVAATTAELIAEHIAAELGLPESYEVRVCVSENVGSTGCYHSK